MKSTLQRLKLKNLSIWYFDLKINLYTKTHEQSAFCFKSLYLYKHTDEGTSKFTPLTKNSRLQTLFYVTLKSEAIFKKASFYIMSHFPSKLVFFYQKL
jgi:hypothetical protein